MPCYHPLRAYRAAGGGITFNEGGDSGSALDLPCGRCIGCRIIRTKAWAMRCMHEASLYDKNCFITLTYGENCEPSLNYEHFQDFIRRLRRTEPVRYFCAGEYGETNKRPHWHAILFGVDFMDRYPVANNLYGSHQLDQLWGHGFASLGQVTPQSTAYVASYCIKKATGPLADIKYSRINLETGEVIKVAPETARMSLKPGIGARWLQRYYKEVYTARDGVVTPGGQTNKAPRYYDKLMEKMIPIERQIEIETNRQIEAIQRKDDNTTDRLRTKEIVAIAKQSEKRKRL